MLKTPIDIEKKFKAFEKSVLKEVSEEIEVIDTELDTYKKAEMQKIQDITLEDTFYTLQSEVGDLALDHAKELSKQGMSFKKQLYIARQELVDKVFSGVRERLLAFASSKDYQNFLVEKIKSYKEKNPCDHCQIFIKASDTQYMDFIKKTYELPCEITISEQIELGGLIFKDTKKGYAINFTIDAALENQKEWFYSNCDLSIGE